MPLYLFHGKVNQMGLLERSLGKPMEGDGLKVADPFLGEEILIYVLMEELEHQAGFNSGSLNLLKVESSEHKQNLLFSKSSLSSATLSQVYQTN